MVGARVSTLLGYLSCSSCQFRREWPLSPLGGLTPWIVDRPRLNEPGSPYSSFANLPDWSWGVKLLLMLLMAVGIVAATYFKEFVCWWFRFWLSSGFLFLSFNFQIIYSTRSMLLIAPAWELIQSQEGLSTFLPKKPLQFLAKSFRLAAADSKFFLYSS